MPTTYLWLCYMYGDMVVCLSKISGFSFLSLQTSKQYDYSEPIGLWEINNASSQIVILMYNKYSTNFRLQFSSVTQLCPTLCNPMNHNTPGLPAHQQLLEFTQTHVHRVGDAIQPFHPLSSPSPPAPNPSQHQGLFQRVNSSNELAKVLEFQLQHQSFQWTPRTDLL